MLKFYRSVLAAGVVAFGLAACGDDVTVTNPPGSTNGVTSVVLAPSPATVTVGQDIQLSASVTTSDSTVSRQLTWTSSNSAVATVDANGKVHGVSVGTTTIVATSQANTAISGAVSVNVVSAPPGVTSFTLSQNAVSLNVGQSQQIASNIQTVSGVAHPTENWLSRDPTVATVSSSGVITGVKAGTTIVVDSINVGGIAQTQAVAVTVTAITPATVSINTISQGAFAAGTNCPGVVGQPVVLSNVACQIDVLLNFNPGGQQVDSVAVYILPQGVTTIPAGTPAAAVQAFAAPFTPPAGQINLSINTAKFGKNPTNATDTTYFTNGNRNLVAVVYIHGAAGQGGAVNTNNVVSLVLNNTDGWAADLVKPTNCAVSTVHAGLTYCGGPGAAGLTTVRLYPVFYTPGRSLSTSTTTIYTLGSPGNGTCGNATFLGAAAIAIPNSVRQVNQGDAKTFGYTSANTPAGTAQVSCVGYENTDVNIPRDNVIVTQSFDNSSNGFATVGFPTPPVTVPPTPFPTLIPSTIVAGATPDSVRLDYKGPTGVTAPSVVGSEGFNWVNDLVNLRAVTGAGADNGVGVNTTSVGIVLVTNVATGATTPLPNANCAANATIPAGQICSVTGLAETNTNVAPPAGDGYVIAAQDVDLLGNPSNVSNSAVFGVDRTPPVIRYSTALTDPSGGLYTSGGGINVTDSTQYVAIEALTPGVNDSIRTEALDGRAGLARFIIIQRRFGQNGGTGATTTIQTINTPCTAPAGTCSAGVPGGALADGYRPAPAVEITNNQNTPGYYTTTESAVDRAGNVSSTYKRTIAYDPGQPLVTGVSPVNNVAGNQPVQFQIGAQNDLEVIDGKLLLFYPNVTTGTTTGTQAGGILFPFPSGGLPNVNITNGFGVTNNIFATAFDASIINPITPTMTLDQYTVSIQETCVGAALGSLGTATGPTTAAACGTAAAPVAGDPIPVSGVGSIAVFRPTNVTVAVRDVFGSFNKNTGASATSGVSADFTSNLLPAFLPAPGGPNGVGGSYTVTYATVAPGCPQGGVGTGGPCVVAGISFRNDPSLSSASVKTFTAVEPLSTTLPLFTRVDLFGLNSSNQWQFINRITVPNPVPVSASCAVNNFVQGVAGCDNGLERYWKYQFINVPAGFTAYRALGVNPNGYGLFSTPQP